MDTFLIPIEGLRLEQRFDVGPVILHAVDDVPLRARSILGASMDHPLLAEEDGRKRLFEWSAAGFECDSVETAIRVVRDALDLLRVFGWSIAMVRPTSFGLSGDVPSGQFLYLQSGDRAGVGWRRTGHALGHGLSDHARDLWSNSPFARLAALVSSEPTSSGHARSMLAVRTLSRATLDDRPDLRMLTTVIAIEAALGGGGKAYELARRAAFFTCGPPTDPQCGRGQNACRFLTTNPRERGSVDLLKRYEKDARSDPAKRCSEWLDFLDRYSDRSSIAHGDPAFLPDAGDADQDLYWALHHLLAPALAWLLDHSGDPIGQLDSEIDSLA